MEKLKNCKACGKEISKSAKVCPSCGAKNKKLLFSKWWFWAIIVVVFVAAVAGGGEKSDGGASVNNEVKNENVDTITYEYVELDTLFEDLRANAMKAEKNYMNKNIEFSAKIASFDSDGKYISVEPVNADEWNLETAMCYIKNQNDKDYLIEKSIGDIITIKGKVKSIGEVLGYSINIDEVK